jgi:hypothetical protein
MAEMLVVLLMILLLLVDHELLIEQSVNRSHCLLAAQAVDQSAAAGAATALLSHDSLQSTWYTLV